MERGNLELQGVYEILDQHNIDSKVQQHHFKLNGVKWTSRVSRLSTYHFKSKGSNIYNMRTTNM